MSENLDSVIDDIFEHDDLQSDFERDGSYGQYEYFDLSEWSKGVIDFECE